jgi:TetR/AcrR family transcriptional repressor of nem operon
MARPTEYDLNKVLDNAMDIFWQKGYSGVSMAQLVSHTGLNRRTMYSLFKDKDGLFRDALEHYYIKLSSKKLAVLKNNPGKKGIELFFKTFKFSDNFKGCLFSNSISEKDFLQTQTFDIPKEYFIKIREGMEANLIEAKSLGEFSGDPKAMAHTLLTVVHGFHVYGKYNNKEEDSDAIFKNVLSMIR